MCAISYTILSSSRTNYRMDAMIIAEIGDFSRFASPDKIVAYAGFSPSTFHSGQLDAAYAHMEKCGSRFLRNAPNNVAKYVSTRIRHLLNILLKNEPKANISSIYCNNRIFCYNIFDSLNYIVLHLYQNSSKKIILLKIL